MNIKSAQRTGGIAALYQAAALVIAMMFYLFVLDYTSVTDPVERLALLMRNHGGVFLTTLLSYVVFGVSLVILSLSLFERFKEGAPFVAKLATVFGCLWGGALIASGMINNIGLSTIADLYGTNPGQAASTWLAVEAVSNGLGGANGEVLGGLFTLLVSWAALQSKQLPKALNVVGLVIGAVGLLSAIPALEALTGGFGALQIIWYVWLGIMLLRGQRNGL